MQVNWSRGFFRAWVVIALAWVGFMGWHEYADKPWNVERTRYLLPRWYRLRTSHPAQARGTPLTFAGAATSRGGERRRVNPPSCIDIIGYPHLFPQTEREEERKICLLFFSFQ
jgi:hypothetical protein